VSEPRRPTIPATLRAAIRQAMDTERKKPVPMIEGTLILSGGTVFDVLQEIDPGLCQVRSRREIKRLMTHAVHEAGGEVRSTPRSSGYCTYVFPLEGIV
jgi:hypothetical protein